MKSNYSQGQYPFGPAVLPMNQRLILSQDFERGRGPSSVLPAGLGFENMPAGWLPWDPTGLGGGTFNFVDCNRKMASAIVQNPPFDHAWAGSIFPMPAIIVPDGSQRLFELQARVSPLVAPSALDFEVVGDITTYAGVIVSSDPGPVPMAFVAAGAEWRASTNGQGGRRMMSRAHVSKWVGGGIFATEAYECDWAATVSVFVRMLIAIERVGLDYTAEYDCDVSSDGMTWARLNPTTIVSAPGPTAPLWVGLGATGSNQTPISMQGFCGLDFVRMRELSEVQAITAPVLPMGGQNWG